jgi:hypothetical protein
MECRSSTRIYNSCTPAFGSVCYLKTAYLYVVDSEECAADYSERYNASDPSIVSQLAEVNQQIDVACRQLKTQVQAPLMLLWLWRQ